MKEPENDTYRFYLAAAMEGIGRRDETFRMLEEIVASGSDLPEAYNYLGYLYVEENKNLDWAITLIKKALELDPANGAYIDSLGWAYFKKGMLDEAQEELERAVEFVPDDATIRNHLAEVYYAKGMKEKAS